MASCLFRTLSKTHFKPDLKPNIFANELSFQILTVFYLFILFLVLIASQKKITHNSPLLGQFCGCTNTFSLSIDMLEFDYFSELKGRYKDVTLIQQKVLLVLKEVEHTAFHILKIIQQYLRSLFVCLISVNIN